MLQVVKACQGGGMESGGVDVEFHMIQEQLPCLGVSLKVVSHVALWVSQTKKSRLVQYSTLYRRWGGGTVVVGWWRLYIPCTNMKVDKDGVGDMGNGHHNNEGGGDE